MKVSLVNIRNYKEDDYLYVGRPSKYGSPYASKLSKVEGTIQVDSKEEALRLYKEYIMKNQHLITELLEELEERNITKLGCWCYPSDCHADIILQLIKEKQNGFEF